MLTLIFGNGPLAGRRLEVGSGLVLGREQADVVIDDPGVSRRHAVIRPVQDGLEIEDLDSLNGTWVNGRRIARATRRLTPTVLSFGAVIVTAIVLLVYFAGR